MALSVGDKVEIQELVARYNQAVDFGNYDDWVDTFTKDGVFEGSRGTFRGHEELKQFTAQRDSARLTIRHWVNNIVIEGDGDIATLVCFLNDIDIAQNGRSVMTGIYKDSLKKVDGVWKFSHRTFIRDR